MSWGLAFVVGVCRAGDGTEGPVQPLPFSHKTHAEAGIACAACHTNPDPGKRMGIARASMCMGCHQDKSPWSPSITKLATLAKKKRDVEWKPVYQIPAFVKFSHRQHTASGNTCQECHGPVQTRAQLAVEYDMKQTGCIACHRVKSAPLLCSTCHD